MAIVSTLEFSSVTRQQYEQLGATLAPSGAPAGIIFHSCGAVPQGWRIIDVWESEEAFSRFVDERLLPAVRALGWPEPRRACFEAHHAGMVGRGA